MPSQGLYVVQSQTLYATLAKIEGNQQFATLALVIAFSASILLSTAGLVFEIRAFKASVGESLLNATNILTAFKDASAVESLHINEMLDKILNSTDEIEIVLNADDLNITFDIGNVEEQLDTIIQQGKDLAAQNEEIFNSEDGWGSSIKAKLEEADSILNAVADTIDIIQGIIEAVSAIIQGVQQATLKASEALQQSTVDNLVESQATLKSILEQLSNGAFNRKVILAIETTTWDFEMPDIAFTSMGAEAMEAVSFDAIGCESLFGEGPINCDGVILAEFAIEAGSFGGASTEGVKVIANKPPFI